MDVVDVVEESKAKVVTGFVGKTRVGGVSENVVLEATGGGDSRGGDDVVRLLVSKKGGYSNQRWAVFRAWILCSCPIIKLA